MKVSVKEAATHLGRSERAVRSALKAGRIKGYKHQGRRVIPRRTLPMTDAERARMEVTVDDLHAAVDAVVPYHIARHIGAHGLAGLRAYRAVRAVFDALDGSPAARSIGEILREAVRALAEGHHQFARLVKIEALTRARRAISRAVADLLLAGEAITDGAELAARLETQCL